MRAIGEAPAVARVERDLRAHAAIAHDGIVEQHAMIGPDGQRLFAVTAIPAAGRTVRRTGVVVCHSFFEMKMLQGAELAFARDAARRGYPGVYVQAPGMGDSEGDPLVCTVEARVDAALRAAEHLCEQAPVERLCFVGARFGAAVAVLAAARRPPPVALALWDPALDAAEYWKHTRRFARVVAALDRARREDADRQLDRRGTAVVVGYTISRELREDLHAIDAVGSLAALETPALVVGLNEPLARSAAGALEPVLGAVERASLGLPKPKNLIRLRIGDARAAAASTLAWMEQRLP